jgi:2-oxo-4-hydroxy-4-carboxy-5-ureidoimidazoline decarboxylase
VASPSEGTTGGTEVLGLEGFNALTEAEATQVLLACCSSPAWARGMLAGRPYASVTDVVEAADRVLKGLTEDEIDAALEGHPRIGASLSDGSSSYSRQEQSGMAQADADLRRGLAEGNRAYEERFGQVYLVSASGKSAQELLDLLHRRLSNDPMTERAVLREELRKINRIRLERVLVS